MKIVIENCNNIKRAEFDLVRKKKTVFVANNGTGKSTISRAIVKHINGNDLSDFESQCNFISGVPSVHCDESLSSILHFDEHYSNNFIFGEKIILENKESFELIQIDSTIKNQIDEVNAILSSFKEKVNESLSPHKNTIEKSTSFRNFNNREFTPRKEFHGLIDKNPLLDKSLLQSFSSIVKSVDSKIDWHNWRMKYEIIETENQLLCPFCSQRIEHDLFNKIKFLETNLNIDAVKSRENLRKIRNSLVSIGNFNVEILDSIIDGSASVNSQINKDKLRIFTDRLQKMKSTAELIFKITSDDFMYMDFDFSAINIKHLENLSDYDIIEAEFEILNRVSRVLKGKIKHINNRLFSAISNDVDILNKFCRNTGIPYIFTIGRISNRNSIILNYVGTSKQVSNPRNRLSFGEKNALATLFFGLISKKQNIDFVIFDDPFSSFDDHKRHFLYNILFSGQGLLKGKTVLYLTHDTDLVFDLVYLESPTKFDYCYTLSNQGGLINFNQIIKSNILNYRDHLIKSIKNSNNEIYKLVNLRKLIEVFEKTNKDVKNINYYYLYQFASSYIKGGEIYEKSGRDSYTLMSIEHIALAKSQLKKILKKYGISKFELDYHKKSTREIIQDFQAVTLIEEKLALLRYIIAKDKNNQNLLLGIQNDISYFLNTVHHFEKDKMLTIDKQFHSDIPNYVNELATYILLKAKEAYGI